MRTTIVVSEDGMFTSEPISVIELCNLFCAALTGAVQNVRRSYEEEEDAPKIDKELFDGLNYSFSKCLELTFPEYELHPEITEEVLKKEDELLEEKVKELELNTPPTFDIKENDDKENATEV